MPKTNFKIGVVCLFVIVSFSLSAQNQRPESDKQNLKAFNRAQDSVWMLNLPKLELPTKYRNRELPAVHDNSTQPYLRPVFSQYYANCGQASSIGYTFTYEIDRVRDLPADTSINQYPPDFAYNFLNYVQGGVSFFHTFEILKKVGMPTIEQYGGFLVDDIQWMSGYEKYRSAMENRIDRVFAIDVSTAEGITNLKHWLVHHMEGSDVGGVALFSGSSPWNTKLLPEGTPEAGKHVILGWNEANHNMTMVGYNDSIRYDYNGDGRYTNDIDLNGDSIIDVKDWEIGAVKIVNSYGIDWCDSGFYYAMYKSLADPYVNFLTGAYTGGIWNNRTIVMEVKEPYEPLLTMKAKLSHASREAIKISVGIVSDTSYQLPDQILEFPIFSYQGDDFPMQGFNDTIEIGLDITPLLAFAGEDEYSRIFIKIDENDPHGIYYGKLLEMNVFDNTRNRSGSPLMVNKEIVNNGTTYASMVKQIDFQKPVINQDEIPPFVKNEPYSFNFSASNGTLPYRWSVISKYIEENYQSGFPLTSGVKIDNADFGSQDFGRLPLALPFTFPFYGKGYDTIWIHVDGFLKFEESDSPWPYFIDKDLQLRSEKMIAPLFTDLCFGNSDRGVWVEESESSVLIRWKAVAYYLNSTYDSDFNFAVRLSEDGKIEFYYGNTYSILNESYACGISNGGDQSYQHTSNSNVFPFVHDQKVVLSPPQFPNKMAISEDGVFTCLPLKDWNYQLSLRVTDRNRISISKKIVLKSLLSIDYQTSNHNITINNKIANIGIDLTNHSAEPIDNLKLKLHLNYANATLSDSIYTVTQLNANQSLHIDSAFQFYYDFQDTLRFATGGKIEAITDRILTGIDYFFEDKKGELMVNLAAIDDGNNGIIEPGETCDLIFNVVSSYTRTLENLNCKLICENPYLILLDDQQKNIGQLDPFSSEVLNYKVQLNDKTPKGFDIELIFRLEMEGASMDYPVKINSDDHGVLIAYYSDDQKESAVRLKDLITETNTFQPEIRTSLDPLLQNDYFLVVPMLGNYPFNHPLTEEESGILENYLKNGGNILLIAGDAFDGDIQEPVHEYFNIQGENNGWYIDIDTLAGEAGTLTENMLFEYTGLSYCNDNLIPLNDAFSILKEPGSNYNFAVANVGENYKTIGSTVDLTGLTGLNSQSSDLLLMKKILEFYGIWERVAANFYTWDTKTCDNNQVQFNNISSAWADSFSWSFEGGIPEQSSEENPLVTYPEPGTYDVRLVVTGEDYSDTLIKPDYIKVEFCSSINEISQRTMVYPNPAHTRLNIQYYPEEIGDLSLKLIDLYGRIVRKKQVNDVVNVLNENLDVEGLRKGIYFLVIEEKRYWSTKKILVN